MAKKTILNDKQRKRLFHFFRLIYIIIGLIMVISIIQDLGLREAFFTPKFLFFLTMLITGAYWYIKGI